MHLFGKCIKFQEPRLDIRQDVREGEGKGSMGGTTCTQSWNPSSGKRQLSACVSSWNKCARQTFTHISVLDSEIFVILQYSNWLKLDCFLFFRINVEPRIYIILVTYILWKMYSFSEWVHFTSLSGKFVFLLLVSNWQVLYFLRSPFIT